MTVPGGVLARGLVVWPDAEGSWVKIDPGKMNVEFFGDHYSKDLQVALVTFASSLSVAANENYEAFQESGNQRHDIEFIQVVVEDKIDKTGKTIFVFAFREIDAAKASYAAGYRGGWEGWNGSWAVLQGLEKG